MAVLLDKLSQRGLRRPARSQDSQGAAQPDSPLPSITDQAKQPARSLTTAPLSQRLSQVPQRGSLGSTFQGGRIPNRFIADLPEKVQLEGIASILAGQDSTSPIINNFVRGMAAQGRSPEEIRIAFVEQQKRSSNPLVLQ